MLDIDRATVSTLEVETTCSNCWIRAASVITVDRLLVIHRWIRVQYATESFIQIYIYIYISPKRQHIHNTHKD